MSLADAQIAGICWAHAATLTTRNIKGFAQVTDLPRNATTSPAVWAVGRGPIIGLISGRLARVRPSSESAAMASQQYVPVEPGKPRRPWYKKKRVIIPAGLLALLMVPSLAGGGNRATTPTAAPAVVTPAAAAGTSTTSAPATTTTKAPEPAKTTTTTTAAKPAEYAAISARDFKLLAKDPDAYKGKAYKIYGVVTQFDAATGTDGFRANTGPTKLGEDDWYDFDQNSILTGDKATLAKIVEDDLFEAKVIVSGSFSYDTQIGGNTTVPAFLVQEITVYGSKS